MKARKKGMLVIRPEHSQLIMKFIVEFCFKAILSLN